MTSGISQPAAAPVGSTLANNPPAPDDIPRCRRTGVRRRPRRPTNLCRCRGPVVLRSDSCLSRRVCLMWSNTRPFVVRKAGPSEVSGHEEFSECVRDICSVFGVETLEVRVGGRAGAVGNQSEVVPMKVHEFCAAENIPSLYAAQNTVFKHLKISDEGGRMKNHKKKETREFNKQKLGNFFNQLCNLNLMSNTKPLEQHNLARLILNDLRFWRTDLREANIWLNYHKVSSQVHYDLYDNLLAMVVGSKRVLLLPPDTKLIKPSDKGNYHEGRFIRKGKHKLTIRKILAREKKAKLCFLKAGDVLRIPEGWYHYVSSAPKSIAVNVWYKSVLENLPKTPILRHLVEEKLVKLKDEVLRGVSPTPTPITLPRTFKSLKERLPNFLDLVSGLMTNSDTPSSADPSDAEFQVASFLWQLEKADKASAGEDSCSIRDSFYESFLEQFSTMHRECSIKNEQKIRNFLGKRSIDSLFHQ